MGDPEQRWTPKSALRVRTAVSVARALGVAAALIGAVHLVLWVARVQVSWAGPGVITMKANMALAHVLAGAAVFLLAGGLASPRRRAAGLLAAALVTLLGAATLAEHFLDVDLGIDQLLAREPPGAPGTAAPGRMGPLGSSTLAILGAGLLLLGARRRGAALAGGAAFCVVLMPAIGVLYGAGALRATALTGIAGPTVVGLLLLSVALSLSPPHGAVPLLWRLDPGGVLLRRMLVPAVLLPVALGFLLLAGERRGLYGTSVGTGLFAASLATLFLLLVWRSAVRLSAAAADRDRTDAARRASEESLRAANEALREAGRRKDEFLNVLSHELRNPLAPIRNSLLVLERAEPGSSRAVRAREVVQRQVTHLARLVDDLLDVTRVARGKAQLRRARLDLAEVARHAAEDHRGLLEESGIRLAVETPGEPVPVDADAARVTQILGNLLQNARKFTDAGGSVVVSVAREGGEAVVRVRDTGEGIPPELVPRLFEPFTQAEQSLARTEGGLGLGLALVKGLAELHGGRVTVSSAGRGAGSEFAVALPLAAAAAVEAPRAPPVPVPEPAGAGSRVLVVDDNVDAADSLADLVRLLGHEAEVAYDGPSAIARVRERRPDVVLCDLGLPGMSGYDVARAVRAAFDGAVRLVAVSGYAQPEDVQRSLEAGFDAHLPKPADLDRIGQLLR